MFPPETIHTTTNLFGEWYNENKGVSKVEKSKHLAFDFQRMNFVVVVVVVFFVPVTQRIFNEFLLLGCQISSSSVVQTPSR